MNTSILADLVFNIPPTVIFVPLNSNSPSSERIAHFDFLQAEGTAYAYQLFFGNMRLIARKESLSLAEPETGERLLQESYDALQWPEYRKRFESLAEQSRHTDEVKDNGHALLRPFRNRAQQIIDDRLVLEPRFCHACLDPLHLQSVLGHDYGNFRETFFSLINIVAASPSRDSDVETTAIQLFHRMKLLEYEFHKRGKIASMDEGEVL